MVALVKLKEAEANSLDKLAAEASNEARIDKVTLLSALEADEVFSENKQRFQLQSRYRAELDRTLALREAAIQVSGEDSVVGDRSP